MKITIYLSYESKLELADIDICLTLELGAQKAIFS